MEECAQTLNRIFSPFTSAFSTSPNVVKHSINSFSTFAHFFKDGNGDMNNSLVAILQTTNSFDSLFRTKPHFMKTENFQFRKHSRHFKSSKIISVLLVFTSTHSLHQRKCAYPTSKVPFLNSTPHSARCTHSVSTQNLDSGVESTGR